jgi:cell division protein FtsB
MSGLDLKEGAKVNLDVKTLVGIVFGILTVAGIWFSLKAELSQLQIDVLRMQDDVKMNHEFRVKWPRGEMGALPDDAEQNLKIEYLQKEVSVLKQTVKELELELAKDCE